MNWGAVAFFAVAGFFAVGLSIKSFRVWRQQTAWVKVEAMVTGAEKAGLEREDTPHTRVDYTFRDSSGQHRSGSLERYFRSEKEGDAVTVMYDPADPSRNEGFPGKADYVATGVACLVFAWSIWNLIATWPS